MVCFALDSGSDRPYHAITCGLQDAEGIGGGNRTPLSSHLGEGPNRLLAKIIRFCPISIFNKQLEEMS